MSEPSWVEAEKVSGRRLDRRLTYTIVDGAVWVDVRFSDVCSGCAPPTPGWSPAAVVGDGCEECGYTGRRRLCEGVPLSQDAIVTTPKDPSP